MVLRTSAHGLTAKGLSLHRPVVLNADNAGEPAHQKAIVIHRDRIDPTSQNIFDFFEAAAFLAFSQKTTKLSLPAHQAGVAPLTLETHEWPDTQNFLGHLSNYRIVACRNLDKAPTAVFLKVLVREGLHLFRKEEPSSFKTVFRATMFQDTRMGGKNDKISLVPVAGQPSDPFQTKWGPYLNHKAEAVRDSQRHYQILANSHLTAE